jgi:hypothetical protein
MSKLLERVLNSCDECVMKLSKSLRKNIVRKRRTEASIIRLTAARSLSEVDESHTATIFVIVFVQYPKLKE